MNARDAAIRHYCRAGWFVEPFGILSGRSFFVGLLALFSGTILLADPAQGQATGLPEFAADAEFQKPRFRLMSASDGMPENSGTAILQDARGFLWIGTINGLVRYNGYDFRTYLPVKGDSTSVGGAVIRNIYEDQDGDLFVLSDGGISIFNRERDEFNLVGNAFDAVQERANGSEGYEPCVTVSTRDIGTRVEIAVADNGIGMDDVVRSRLFEPFFTTKSPGSGTGLGLSLSHDIVTKGHGREFRVDSVPGQGTTFTVVIPTRSQPRTDT